jgi:hypothetical protein
MDPWHCPSPKSKKKAVLKWKHTIFPLHSILMSQRTAPSVAYRSTPLKQRPSSLAAAGKYHQKPMQIAKMMSIVSCGWLTQLRIMLRMRLYT